MTVDLSTIEAGDTIVLRGGMRRVVREVRHVGDTGSYTEYSIRMADRRFTYAKTGAYVASGPDAYDIVEIIPSDEKPVVECETPVPPPQDPAVDLLDEAKRSVCGQRSQQYGSVEDNFRTIAAYWTTHLRGVGYDFTDPEQCLSASDVAILMMLMKCARLSADPTHKDSAVDCAGYAACLARLQAKGEA